MAIIDEYIENQAKKTPAGTDTTTVASATSTPSTTQPPIANAQDYIKRTLGGQNPIVQNAQAQQNTASAVQKYIAGKTARDTSAQAGFDPGTLQYQRTQDRAMAGAESASLQGQNQVNELTRQTSQQALQDQATLDAGLIGSLTDPRAQNYLRGIAASGGDVNAAYAEMFENGQLRPEYSSGTPGEQAREAAEDLIKNTFPDLDPESQEFQDQVNKYLQDTFYAETNPIGDEVTDAQITALRDKAKTGQTLTEEEMTVLANNTDAVANSALPSTKEQIEAAKSDNPFVKLEDGNVYQIQDYYQQKRWDRGRGFSDRNSDWTVLKNTTTGDIVYVRSDGVQIDYQPPSPEKGHRVRYNSQKGVWEELYGNSGGPTGKVYDPVSQKWIKPGRTDA